MFRDALYSQKFEPEWEAVKTPAGDARVYGLVATEKDEFDFDYHQANKKDFRARLIVATVRNEDGTPAFTKDDIPKLTKCPVHLIEPLIDAAIRVNKMSDADTTALRKN